MAQKGADSGLGSEDRAQIAKDLLGSLSESVQNAVVKLTNTNRNSGELKNVTVWAAERVKKIAVHSANVAASKIIEKIEEQEIKKREQEQEQKRAEGLLQAMATLVGMFAATESDKKCSEKNVTDCSSGVIKYPWEKQEELGHGAFGKVFRAKGADDFEFAVKEIQSQGQEAECLQDEIKTLKKLSHVNIVRCFGFAEGGGKIFMYLELMTGSIADRMTTMSEACTIAEAKRFTIDMVKGLTYLHGEDIIHRDIKCANVFLDVSGKAKLGDMGLSKEHQQLTVTDHMATGGTIAWMSPEVISEGKVGKRADVWGLGCTVYEMLKRGAPFADLGMMRVIINLNTPATDGNYPEHKKLIESEETFPISVKKFLLRIFVPLEKRPYIEGLANDEWIS